MRNLMLIFCAATCFVTSCTVDSSYVITGTTPDETFENKMVYLFDYNQKEAIDSFLIENNAFQFKGNAEKSTLCYLSVNRLHVPLILEKGEIFVDLAQPANVKGTLLNEELFKVLGEINSLNQSISDYYNELKDNEDIDEDERRENFTSFQKDMTQKKEDIYSLYFNNNKDNLLGAFVLWQWSSSLSPEKMDSLHDISGDHIRNFAKVKEIIYKNERLKATSAGMMFTDFTIENGNLDGSSVSLSDYVGNGKYVLVDFWASWCGPCIREIPVLKEVYEQYKGDNFELLGVAVWDKRDDTLQGIEKHELTWPKIIDAQSIPTDLYGIRGIPQIILFAPDGTIVARDLRGDAIKEKLAELL